MNLYRPNALLDSAVRPRRPGMALPVSRTSTAPRCRAGWPTWPRSASPTPSTASAVAGCSRSIAGRSNNSSGPTTTPSWPTPNCPSTQPIHADCDQRRASPSAQRAFADLGPATRGCRTPSLAHRDKKINLNYPLPVSNDPDEPIRQKWITDTYQLLKWILPPRAVDTPEELAQLSQFVINIIDFRDPDCTMTHWQNPDVLLRAGTARESPGRSPTPATAPTLVLASSNPANAIPAGPVRHGVQPGRAQRGTRVLLRVPGRRLAGQPVLRRAGQHADAVVLRGPAAAGPAVPTHPTRASSTWAGSSTRREMIPIPAAAGTWSSPKTRPIAAPIPIAGNWSREASSTR